MTFFPQVRTVRTVAVFIGSVSFPLGGTVAFAQGTTCTGAPPRAGQRGRIGDWTGQLIDPVRNYRVVAGCANDGPHRGNDVHR